MKPAGLNQTTVATLERRWLRQSSLLSRAIAGLSIAADFEMRCVVFVWFSGFLATRPPINSVSQPDGETQYRDHGHGDAAQARRQSQEIWGPVSRKGAEASADGAATDATGQDCRHRRLGSFAYSAHVSELYWVSRTTGVQRVIAPPRQVLRETLKDGGRQIGTTTC